ncbi:MAG: YceI family protein [Alphaproteobacteria bacterium]
MRLSTLPLAAAALIAFGASAQDFKYTAPATSLAGVPSGTYELDKNHASILFSYLHMGFSHPVSRFKHFDATLKFDATHPEASKIDVTINPGSVDSGSEAMDTKFASKELFDIAQFPSATFTSTRIVQTSPTTGKLTGELTLHGVTKPVTLDVTFNGAGPTR